MEGVGQLASYFSSSAWKRGWSRRGEGGSNLYRPTAINAFSSDYLTPSDRPTFHWQLVLRWISRSTATRRSRRSSRTRSTSPTPARQGRADSSSWAPLTSQKSRGRLV